MTTTQLRKLRNNELCYMTDEQGNYKLIQKVGTIDGMTRCRAFYDTIRPDLYLDNSTEVIIIPLEVQKCLKSGTV